MNRRNFLALFLLFFGLLTLFVGSSVLFDWMGMRAKEGNYVPFVVQANVFCALLYLLAAGLVFRKNRQAVVVLLFAVVILLATFVALYFHMASGGLYEQKTLFAMTFRTTLTALLSYLVYRSLRKP
jgi:hypothetical protein